MKNIIQFIFTAFVTIIIIELYFQVAEVELPIDEIHSEIGRKKKAGARINRVDEGFFIGKVNNQGFLGKDINLKKDDNELRIALLGDSYVQSQVVFDKYSHRAVLEKELKNAFPEKEIAVMNFGMAGFGLKNMFCYDKTFVEKYKPDIRLYYFANTTIDFNHKSFVPSIEINDGELKIINEFHKSGIYRFFNKYPFLMKSSLLRMLYKAIDMKKEAGGIIFGKFYEIQNNEINNRVITEGSAEKLDNVNSKIITELSKMKNIFIVFREKPSKELSKLIDNLEVNTINLYKELNEYDSLGINLNYFEATDIEGHWNHQGNQVVGEYVGKEIIGYLEDESLIK